MSGDWKQKRAEGEKSWVRSGKRILIEEDRGLGENTAKLQPFVSSKVIMLAQQWVENSQAREEREKEEGEAFLMITITSISSL